MAKRDRGPVGIGRAWPGKPAGPIRSRKAAPVREINPDSKEGQDIVERAKRILGRSETHETELA